MSVWIVTINNRINSAWADQDSAMAHVRRLIEANGDQLAVKAREIEVRTS